jgi:hypothetical protein
MKNKHEIEKIAFELYQRDGYMHGRELDHWFEAERIFHSRHTATVIPSASKKASSSGMAKKKGAAKESKVAAERKTAKKIQTKAKSGKSGPSQKEASF